MRPDWDSYFMKIACAISERSTFDRAFVGCVLVFGNSGTEGFRSQVIGYRVDTGGAKINITYNAGNNYQAAQPMQISLLE